MSYNRSGNKWSVNEILSLQREYELLEMTIQEIALQHSRSVEAILYKLESEEFIDNFISARGYNNYSNKNDEKYDEGYDLEDDEDYQEQDADEDYEEQDYADESESDDDDEIVILTHRVDYVENTVNEIKIMVTNFLNSMNNSISITSSLDV
jgi:hypothetical protein